MRRLLQLQISHLIVVGSVVFVAAAGYRLGGGSPPALLPLSQDLIALIVVSTVAVGVYAHLLSRPETIGRITPTLYALVALLPLLRFQLPAITIIRFVPLLLMAPVVYGLYRQGEPDASHTRVARAAMFAAFATAVSALVANRADTDLLRLILMVGGIVLLVGAAPRAWSASWRWSVERAVTVTFWLTIASTVLLLPLPASFADARVRGVFESPNTLGAVLALTTPLAAERSRLPMAYWTIAFAVSIGSGSRGGLLALTTAAVVVLFHKRQLVPLFMFALVGALVFASGVVRTQADHERDFDVSTRALIWDEVSAEVLEAPIAGHGFGTVDQFEYSPETQFWVGSSPQTHNSWLDGAYEQGLIGLLPWIAALAIGFVAAVRAGPAWSATIVAGLISATFESWMFAIGGGIGSIFWLIFGAASLSPPVSPQKPFSSQEQEVEEDPHAELVDAAPEEQTKRSTFRLEIAGLFESRWRSKADDPQ